MTDIYTVLTGLGIAYKKYEPPPVFTVEEAEKYSTDIPGGRSKNLFLRNKKGNKYFLIIAETSTNIDFENIAYLVGESSVGFASPERLERVLGVKSGAVSPFALVNDEAKVVHVLVDNHLFKSEQLGFHPNENAATLVVQASDLRRFLESTGNTVQFLDF